MVVSLAASARAAIRAHPRWRRQLERSSPKGAEHAGRRGRDRVRYRRARRGHVQERRRAVVGGGGALTGNARRRAHIDCHQPRAGLFLKCHFVSNF